MDEIIRKAVQLIRIADLVSYVVAEKQTPQLRLLRKRAASLYRAIEASKQRRV